MADTVVTPSPASPGSPGYKDRSTGLLVFGIIEICLAALAALAALFGLLTSGLRVTAAHEPQQLGSVATGLLFYVFLAILWVVLGIGSIQARRWARALILVISWVWLLCGAYGVVIGIAMLPNIIRASIANIPPGSPAVPTGLMAGVITFMMVLFAIFYVGVPLALILFYRSTSVRETCNQRDPVERWTDRTPLPVIGASFLLFFGGCAFAITSLTRPVLPLFVWVLTGIPARITSLVFAAIWISLAVAIFRRLVWSWWVTMAALVLAAASSVLAFSRGGIFRLYEKSGMSGEQLQIVRLMLQSPVFVWGMFFVSLVFLGYVVWLRRYFLPARNP